MPISAPSSTRGHSSGLKSGLTLILTSGSSGLPSRLNSSAMDSLASTKTPRTALLRCKGSGCDAGQRQHGVQQHIGACRTIGLGGVLELIVADAVLAGHEHHRSRNLGVEVAGVVAGAGSDAAVGIAEHLGRILHGVD